MWIARPTPQPGGPFKGVRYYKTLEDSQPPDENSKVAIPRPKFANEPCPKGSFGFPGNNEFCYRIMNHTVDFGRAEHVCNNYGGHLASIWNPDENEVLKQQALLSLPKLEQYVWIGATENEEYALNPQNIHRQQIPNFGWFWTDTSPFLYASFPDPFMQTPGECMVMDLYTGKWLYTRCHEKLPFICKLHKSLRLQIH